MHEFIQKTGASMAVNEITRKRKQRGGGGCGCFRWSVVCGRLTNVERSCIYIYMYIYIYTHIYIYIYDSQLEEEIAGEVDREEEETRRILFLEGVTHPPRVPLLPLRPKPVYYIVYSNI
jgi:hypothetical protein